MRCGRDLWFATGCFNFLVVGLLFLSCKKETAEQPKLDPIPFSVFLQVAPASIHCAAQTDTMANVSVQLFDQDGVPLPGHWIYLEDLPQIGWFDPDSALTDHNGRVVSEYHLFVPYDSTSLEIRGHCGGIRNSIRLSLKGL